jgi:hypothetical protein
MRFDTTVIFSNRDNHLSLGAFEADFAERLSKDDTVLCSHRCAIA